jgi:hypothetical protein
MMHERVSSCRWHGCPRAGLIKQCLCALGAVWLVLIASMGVQAAPVSQASPAVPPASSASSTVMIITDKDRFFRFIYQDWSDPVLNKSPDVYHYLFNFSMPMVMYHCVGPHDDELGYQYQQKFTQEYRAWFPLYASSIQRGRDIILERVAFRKFSLVGYLLSWSSKRTDWLYPNMEMAMDSPCRDVLYELSAMTDRAQKKKYSRAHKNKKGSPQGSWHR